MISTSFFSKISTKILVAIYVIVIFWMFTIILRGIQETTENYAFSLFYSVMPLVWGLIGYRNAQLWGGFKSSVGRSLVFLSAGITAWGLGNLVFAYYNLVFKIPVPYPSLADVGFVLLYPLSAIGVAFLFRTTGASFGLRHKVSKFFIFIVPLFLIWLSYYFLYVIARGGVITFDGNILKLILDIAYPIGDVIVITLATIIYLFSFKYLGGLFKLPIILIIVGFVSNYIADFLFSYTTTLGTYFVGKWVDIFYPTTFLLLGLGLDLLDPRMATSKSLADKKPAVLI